MEDAVDLSYDRLLMMLNLCLTSEYYSMPRGPLVDQTVLRGNTGLSGESTEISKDKF